MGNLRVSLCMGFSGSPRLMESRSCSRGVGGRVSLGSSFRSEALDKIIKLLIMQDATGNLHHIETIIFVSIFNILFRKLKSFIFICTIVKRNYDIFFYFSGYTFL